MLGEGLVPHWSWNALTPIILVLSGALSAQAQSPTAASASSASTPVYTVAGTWTDSLGFPWTLTQDQAGNISGSVDFSGAGCPCGPGMCGGTGHNPIWVVSGALTSNNFTLYATNPASGDVCTSGVEVDMTIEADGITAGGYYLDSVGGGSLTMTLTVTCAMVLNNSVSASIGGSGTSIDATFTPAINGVAYGLAQAEQLCGFTNFDWIQMITSLPDPSPFFQNNPGSPASPIHLTSASTPYNDPPQNGYTYEPAGWGGYPFYFDAVNDGLPVSLANFETAVGLTFHDAPCDPCIAGPFGPSPGYALNPGQCGNMTAPNLTSIAFSTHLAGVYPDNTGSDLGVGFNWSSDFNGTSGGIATTRNLGSADPGSGVGGVTIAGITPTTTYQPPGKGPVDSSLLPQFVFGGGWYSALYFTNPTGASVSFPVNFVSDAATSLTVPSLGGALTQVDLAAHGTAIVEAPNVGGLLEGYAGFTLPSGVTGYGVFRQSVAGRADQEAVVPLSDANATSNTLIWDDTNLVTSVAIANPSPVPTTVSVILWDAKGNAIGATSITQPPGSKTETTLRSLPGFSGMVGQRGSARFTVSSGSVGVLGLRFDGAAFTSIPAVSESAVNPASSVLPQLAFGGGWYSALYFTNVTGSAVSFPVDFVSDAGEPLTVPSVGGTSTQVNVAAHGTAIIEAPNVGSLSEGYARFSLPTGVYGYGVFRQSVAGRADQEAVVPFSDAAAASNTLTWDETNFVTAVAIVNPSSTTETVAVTLWDEGGNIIGTSSIPLQPNSKTETTLRTLPGLSGMVGQRGSAQFAAAEGAVAVLGLRFDGAAFTSIPNTNPATIGSTNMGTAIWRKR
jgi:P pilus assembly chaperone PapD